MKFIADLSDELTRFMDDITKSGRGLTSIKVGKLYAHSRKKKCMTMCALLANMMDPSVTFMQTLIGCYAQGLRDKEIKLLNTFGVTASVFHILQHGSW